MVAECLLGRRGTNNCCKCPGRGGVTRILLLPPYVNSNISAEGCRDMFMLTGRVRGNFLAYTLSKESTSVTFPNHGYDAKFDLSRTLFLSVHCDGCANN